MPFTVNFLKLTQLTGLPFHLILPGQKKKNSLVDIQMRNCISANLIEKRFHEHVVSAFSRFPLISNLRSPELRSLLIKIMLHWNWAMTYILQNSSPGMKQLHVDQNQEEVEESCDDHEERQLPDESWHQVKGILLLLKGPDVSNHKHMPCLNLGGWYNNILKWSIHRWSNVQGVD